MTGLEIEMTVLGTATLIAMPLWALWIQRLHRRRDILDELAMMHDFCRAMEGVGIDNSTVTRVLCQVKGRLAEETIKREE